MTILLLALCEAHRRLQNCVGTPGKTWLHHIWFTIAESAFCHYTVPYTYVCVRIMLYAGDHVSSCLVLVIWVCMIRNNPGNAWVCPGLQAPMVRPGDRDNIGLCTPKHSGICGFWLMKSIQQYNINPGYTKDKVTVVCNSEHLWFHATLIRVAAVYMCLWVPQRVIKSWAWT